VIRGSRRLQPPARVGTAVLVAWLKLVATSFHPAPEQLGHDEGLMQALLELYPMALLDLIEKLLAPFVEANTDALGVLYREHAVFPEAELLDLVEAPMILELLERDSARLASIWPGSPAPLIRLADAAGIPIAHFA
jgi:hypothetical protein